MASKFPKLSQQYGSPIATGFFVAYIWARSPEVPGSNPGAVNIKLYETSLCKVFTLHCSVGDTAFGGAIPEV